MENEIEQPIYVATVTPMGNFDYQSFPLVEGNVYNITQEELEKLANHELKWSTEEYETEEPVYEEYEERYLSTEPDLEKPITETRERYVYPDDDETKEPTLETYEAVIGYDERQVYRYRPATRQVGTKTVTKTRPILIPNDPTEENDKNAAFERISELKKLLAQSDYEAIKYAEGEMTAEEYAPYKIQRAAWRAEINSLEETLNGRAD